MRRREFITMACGAGALARRAAAQFPDLALACAATFAPLAARAQQAKVRAIGILALGNPPPESFFKGVREALREIGYSEDRNIKLEMRTAGGRAGALPQMAAELVRLNVDVIVAYQTPAATAAKRATGEIPIVMAGVGDPVGTGLVPSLRRPEGNVTGTTAGAVEVAGKLVELIRELLPSARRFAVLANETDTFTRPFLAEIERVARNVDLEVEPYMVRPAGPLDAAFETMTFKRVEAVIIQGSLVHQEAMDLAAKHRLPSLSSSSALPRAGGLMSYSPGDFFRETAVYVDKLLKGAKPVDLPVSFPTKFEIIINLKTAKAIGLTIPPTLLARADQEIE